MARSFNGSDQYLSLSSAILSTHPLTFACWFYSNSLTVAQDLMSIKHSTNTAPLIILNASGTIGGDPVRMIVRDDSSGTQNPGTTTGYSTATWQHACGVWANANDTRVFLDGGNKDTDTLPTLTGLTVNNTSLGARIVSGSPSTPLDGYLAECAIWNVALSDAEVALLAAKYSPLFIRRQSLVAYWPLWGTSSPEPDIIGGYNMTLNNSPTSVAHPPGIIYPARIGAIAPDIGGMIIV